MKIILLLLGPGGSGKSTLARNLASRGVEFLRPFTTRKQRPGETDEYDFIDLPSLATLDPAWTLEKGDDRYGLQKAKLINPSNQRACTLFHQRTAESIESIREQFPEITFVLVGLDTIASSELQEKRVNGDTTRLAKDEYALTLERNKMRACADIILKGNQNDNLSAALEIFHVLEHPGVLPKITIERFLRVGVLLDNISHKDNPQIEGASYDLRLGDEVWNGSTLDMKQQKTVPIEGYSFIIAKMLETAVLPTFVTARFDLKVSKFFNGIILSNGPQVDPGYRGALFCLLFNCDTRSDICEYAKHITTIEFHATSRPCPPYVKRYQDQISLHEFMDSKVRGTAPVSVLSKITEIETRINTSRNWVLTAGLTLLGIILAAVWFATTYVSKRIDELDSRKRELSNTLDTLGNQHIKKLEEMEQSAIQRIQRAANPIKSGSDVKKFEPNK